MFAHFLFQIFVEGGTDWVPLAVSSSIQATPTSGVYRVDNWYFSTPVLQSAGRSTTFTLRRILQPPTGGRVHVSNIHIPKWWRRIYICRYRPSVHNESSAQEERNPWVQFVCDSTHLPIIGYSSIRSSRRPGIGRRNLSLTLQKVLGFVKVSFSVYFT